MRALDTCILARWVLRDDPAQAAVADDLLAQPFFLGVSVLVELSWVLESSGGMGRETLARTLAELVSLPTAWVQNADGVRWAIERFAQRGDFADLMHVANSTPAAGFITFDKAIVKDAGPNAPVPVELIGS